MQKIREFMGLNHDVRGRETIPLTPIATTPMNTPIIASLPFLSSSLDSEEMMSPRVDTIQFTYQNKLSIHIKINYSKLHTMLKASACMRHQKCPQNLKLTPLITLLLKASPRTNPLGTWD